MSKTLKIISVILSVLTILGVFSVANPVLAAEVNEEYAITQTIENIKTEKEEAVIIGEIESKRDKYTKVFQKSDGASVAVITSTPVHYEKDGVWVDIDNTLIETEENNEKFYENKSNDFTVTLPQEMDENDAVSIEKDGYTISFTLDGYDVFEKNEKSKSKKKEKVKKEKSKTKIDDSFIDKNETLVYESVGENTDIEYSVTATGLKEDIILTKKPKSEVSYTYTILAENLNGNPHEDGSVSFTDSKGNVIFNIPAPIMFDAKNKSSTDITVKFSGEKGNYKLTYTPSYDWLKKEAKYPVTIDPVITVNYEKFTIVDTYVLESENLSTFDSNETLVVYNTNLDEAISLIKFNSSNISFAECLIKNVTLNMYYFFGNYPNNDSVTIGAYPVNSSWNVSSVNYITKPTLGELLDSQVFNNSTSAGYKGFDITRAFLFNGNIENGFALKQTVTTTSENLVVFNSSDSSTTMKRPYFTIEYYETNGVKNQFDYHMQDVGRAGTVYYNDFTGQVHIEREDIGLYCLYEPVNIKSYYNSGLGSNITNESLLRTSISPFSLGWSTNYNQTIEYVGEIGTGRYLYRDEDGDVIYLKKDTDTTYIEDPDMFSNSKGYKLYGEKNGNSTQLVNIRIVDSNNRTMYFDNYGNLTRITTSIENTENSSDKVNYSTTIVYRTDVIPFYQKPYLIDKIIDNLGREYRFSYIDNETLGFPMVSSISVFNNDGTQITIGGKDYKINYTYTNQNFNGTYLPTLSTVTYPDGGIVNYTLTETRQLLKNIDGYTIDINKPNSNSHTITEKVVRTTTTTGNVLTINRSNCFERAFTDVNNIQQTKQFDAYGRVTCEVEGTTVVPRVFSENNVALGEVNSRLYNTSLTPVSYENDNLIKNSSFLSGTTDWSVSTGVSIVTNEDAFANTASKSSLKFDGATSPGLYAIQYVNASNNYAGDQYYFEFSCKQTNSRHINEVAGCLVQIEVETIDNGNVKWEEVCKLETNPLNNNWQTYAYTFSLDKAYNKITVTLLYSNQHGTAYFDDIKLINTYKATATSGSSGSSGTTGGTSTGTQCTCDGCTDLNCPCTNCGSSCTLTSCKRGFNFTNSAESSSVSITDGEKSMGINSVNNSTYNYNFPKEKTDINGSTTKYFYNQNTGLLMRNVDNNNGSIAYTYNALGELASVSQTVSGLGTMQTSYSYENDRVKSITHNGFSYNYEYDVWGNVSSVKVGNQPLVSYNYDSGENRNRINKITYGNGDYTVYTFNDNGNITAIKSYESSGSVKSIYQYTYSAEGSLTAVLDVINKIQTLYNGQNVTIKHLNDPGTSDDVVYNTYTITDDGDIVETFGGMSYTTTDVSSTYKSSTGGSVDKSKLILNPENNTTNTPLKEYDFTSESDYFGRTLNKNTQTFYAEEDGINIDMFFKSQYKYKDLSTTQTTTLIDSYKSTVGLCAEIDGVLQTEVYEEIEYFYDYDNVGNITRIYFKEYDDDGSWLRNVTVCSYVYDKANQLVRENNATLEKTYVFVYDVGGNIVSKKEYEFAEGVDLSNVEPIDITNYSYDSVWKDKLEYFNDVEIKYDEIGNPINYVKKDVIDESSELGTLSWNGRQLESVIVGDSTYKYSYDADGLRTKTEMYDSDGSFNGAMYYLWRDGKLSGYTNVNSDGETEQTIKMLFDNTGESIGYTCYNATNNSEETFYFGKNVFGDIITVYSDDGDALVTYTYDAWGCFTAQAHGTTAAQIIAAIVALMFTPITYRGYNYDLNTGLYYLQSRYYNPAYGRFLNADDTDILELTKGTVHGANLFAYCNNNPVMNVDYNGFSGIGFFILLIVLLALPGLEDLMFGGEFSLHKFVLDKKFQKACKTFSDLVKIKDYFLNFGVDIVKKYYSTYLIFATHAKNIVDCGTGVNSNPEYQDFNSIAPGLSSRSYKEICLSAYDLAIELELISRGKKWDSMSAMEQYVFVHEMLFYDQKSYEYLSNFARLKLVLWSTDKFVKFYKELFKDYTKVGGKI